MNSHNLGDTSFMALKLDMSKAYDWVEWDFLEDIMQQMGFNERWIGLILICVKIVSYSILVNGEPKVMIHTTRGIRQGGPLSPFLFLLCIEGLLSLITNAANFGEIKGFSLCKKGPELTHLLFANESFFCKATTNECAKVFNILEIYELASGHKVNRSKTTLFFSKSTLENVCQAIKGSLGLQEITLFEKYLGLPFLIGRKEKRKL